MGWYNSSNWDGLIIHNIVYIMCNVCNGLQKRYDALGGFSGNNPSFYNGDGNNVQYIDVSTWVDIPKSTSMLRHMVSNYNTAVTYALKLKTDFSSNDAYVYYRKNDDINSVHTWDYNDDYIYDKYNAATKYWIYSNVTPWVHLRNYINQFKYIVSLNSSGSIERYGCDAETKPETDVNIEYDIYLGYCYDNINRLYNELEVVAHAGEELVYRYYAGGIPDVPRYYTGSISSNLMEAYIAYSYVVERFGLYPNYTGTYSYINGYKVYSLSYNHGSIYSSIPVDLYRSYTYFSKASGSSITISGLSSGLNQDSTPSFSGSYSINYNRSFVENQDADSCAISRTYVWDCSSYFEGYIE